MPRVLRLRHEHADPAVQSRGALPRLRRLAHSLPPRQVSKLTYLNNETELTKQTNSLPPRHVPESQAYAYAINLRPTPEPET